MGLAACQNGSCPSFQQRRAKVQLKGDLVRDKLPMLTRVGQGVFLLLLLGAASSDPLEQSDRAPSAIRLGETTSTSISLRWRPPKTQDPDLGPLNGYRVLATPVQGGAPVKIFSNESFGVVDRLEP